MSHKIIKPVQEDETPTNIPQEDTDKTKPFTNLFKMNKDSKFLAMKNEEPSQNKTNLNIISDNNNTNNNKPQTITFGFGFNKQTSDKSSTDSHQTKSFGSFTGFNKFKTESGNGFFGNINNKEDNTKPSFSWGFGAKEEDSSKLTFKVPESINNKKTQCNNNANLFANMIKEAPKQTNNKKAEEDLEERENESEESEEESKKEEEPTQLISEDYSKYNKIFSLKVENFYLFSSEKKSYISKGKGFLSIEESKTEDKDCNTAVIAFRNQMGMKLVEGFLNEKFQNFSKYQKEPKYIASFSFVTLNENKQFQLGYAKVPFIEKDDIDEFERKYNQAISFVCGKGV